MGLEWTYLVKQNNGCTRLLTRGQWEKSILIRNQEKSEREWIIIITAERTKGYKILKNGCEVPAEAQFSRDFTLERKMGSEPFIH